MIVGESVAVGFKVEVAVLVTVDVWLGVEVLVGIVPVGVRVLVGVLVLVGTMLPCRVFAGTRVPGAGVQLTIKATHKPRIKILFVMSRNASEVQFSPRIITPSQPVRSRPWKAIIYM